ncbi:hypothetical protein J2128_001022 [Methanomicrobium sp. W14]|nr:hypothetical protein [Methanomicrobium sp. W14]
MTPLLPRSPAIQSPKKKKKGIHARLIKIRIRQQAINTAPASLSSSGRTIASSYRKHEITVIILTIEKNTDEIPYISGIKIRVIMGVKQIATTWATIVPLTSLNTSLPKDFFEIASIASYFPPHYLY